MTCIKTGAKVFLPDYNIACVADIYQIGTAIIVRFPCDPTSREESYVRGVMPDKTTHVVDCNHGDNLIRFDLGMVIVENDAVEIINED